MKCPYCGGEMEKGTLRGMSNASWFPNDYKDPTLRSLLTWEGIKSLCTPPELMMLHNGQGWEFGAGATPARHCPSCNLFLFRGKIMDDKEE